VNRNNLSADPRDPFFETAELTQQERQLLACRLKLRPELVSDFRDEYDGLFVVIEDPVRNKFYSLGQKEYKFLTTLDGKKTVGDAVGQFADPAFDQTAALAICNFAINSNLVVNEEIDNSGRLELQYRSKKRLKAISRLNLISFQVKLFNPSRLLQWLTPKTQWLFSLPFLCVWLLAAMWATSVAWARWDSLCTASIGILSGWRWIWLLVVWAGLKIVHEAAHAVACKRYGGDVPEAGILLLLFTPLAYVDVTSSWRFASRWQRIVVAAAGMYVELFLSFVALLIWSRQPEGLLSDICYNIVVMSSVTTVLFNANPLMRFDGYYMLADALGVNNLYSKGTQSVSDWLCRAFTGVPTTATPLAASERLTVYTYGVLACCWKILVCVGLIIGASVLFQGAGKIIAAIGCLFFFGLPVGARLKRFFSRNSGPTPKLGRLAFSTLALAVILSGLFTWLRAPAIKSAPAIVQFAEETPIRSATDGFIDQICVSSGQVLAVLSNRELEFEILSLEQDVAASRIQERIHQQRGELALVQAEQERLQGYQQQLKELRQQYSGLTIRAPFDGFVFARGLASKPGSFAKLGTTLMTIARKQTKEIVVAVEQQSWESLKGKTGFEMRVAFPSNKLITAEVARIDPKASDKLRLEELSVTAGGPLSVKRVTEPREESSTRLLTPHFYVDLELSSEESVRLFAGQRGRAFYRTNDQSMGNYLMVQIDNWVREKIEIATRTATF